jgi:hypothetical protein
VNQIQFEKDMQGEKYGKRPLVFKKSRLISKNKHSVVAYLKQ